MDSPVWQRVLAFDFDAPISEYGFSLRLAKENFWTRNFTQKAILEYKKFMFLAAQSDMMVSPSEVVDIVWHQHLVFTQSYADFCAVLGKQIQHVPSTHNRADAEKFRLAKERTQKLYAATFGEQPADIWEMEGMYESLRLEKAKIKIRTFLVDALIVFALLITPAYYLLRPFFVTLNSQDFFVLYFGLIAAVFIVLIGFNRSSLKNILDGVHPSSFLFDLHPVEIVLLKTQQLSRVIDATLDRMITNGKVQVIGNSIVTAEEAVEAESAEEHAALEVIKNTGRIAYASFVNVLASKPVFQNTQNMVDALKKYILKSKKFGTVFYINVGLLGLVLMFGVVRLITGILRDRPVGLLAVLLVVLAIAIVVFLLYLSTQLVGHMLPKYYKAKLPMLRNSPSNWEWDYAFGAVTLNPLLTAMVAHSVASSSSSFSDSSSSDSSSCGSSCSSCGGCGGGD